MMERIKCSKCGYKMDIPQHCDRIMHKEGDRLVCWMGTHCSVQLIPEHCGQQMSFI